MKYAFPRRKADSRKITNRDSIKSKVFEEERVGFGEGRRNFLQKVSPLLPNSSRAFLPADGGHAPLSHGVVAALKEPRPDGLVSGGEGDDAADGFDAELGMPQGVAEPVFPVVEQACPQRSVGRDAEPVTGRAEMAGKRRDQAEAPEAWAVRA